ncbi:LysM peptidoglycan-binding domain-containing protein [Hymenobacter sp. NBH84]|uniref:LysM peptidoglycan-binding domain-containing protein n=1 Tax=Hymenobacter sp. NBH84 TaxID=2596915 RepID=UPI001628538D|nr:LysM peptidoglycan-binding domain-containing protein [Hymenobacter sp. NBH84]QNE39715.1 LysM peptidoglycan-binding domain-containing protein [Hymenobacter sp. NBH84]
MIRLSFLLVLLVGASRAVCATTLPPAALPDSIGVEYRGNKMLIKHLVTAGETLYGLSRRYKVTVESIVEANPQLQGALVKGQVVLVPRTRVVLTPAPATRATAAASSAATPAARALPTDARGNHVYTVKPGQTLFSIAQRYGVSTTELIRLNRLPASGVVNANQTLIIVPAAAGSVAAAKPAPTRPAPTVVAPPAAAAAPRPEDPDRNRPKETLAPAPTETATTDGPEEERAPEHASEIVSRVRESGLAAIIEGSTTEKYLALHKTAPVGTIMQVRNIMNGQSVYVRVIGHLPDTGDNANMLVRLSPRAVQRLVTPDQRFRVETSYVP